MINSVNKAAIQITFRHTPYVTYFRVTDDEDLTKDSFQNDNLEQLNTTGCLCDKPNNVSNTPYTPSPCQPNAVAYSDDDRVIDKGMKRKSNSYIPEISLQANFEVMLIKHQLFIIN